MHFPNFFPVQGFFQLSFFEPERLRSDSRPFFLSCEKKKTQTDFGLHKWKRGGLVSRAKGSEEDEFLVPHSHARRRNLHRVCASSCRRAEVWGIGASWIFMAGASAWNSCQREKPAAGRRCILCWTTAWDTQPHYTLHTPGCSRWRGICLFVCFRLPVETHNNKAALPPTCGVDAVRSARRHTWQWLTGCNCHTYVQLWFLFVSTRWCCGKKRWLKWMEKKNKTQLLLLNPTSTLCLIVAPFNSRPCICPKGAISFAAVATKN